MGRVDETLIVPSLRSFIFIKYLNLKTKRWARIMVCDVEGCDRIFRKWQSIFDHLRFHYKEKPFECPVINCGMAFTQKANLLRHLNVHTPRSSLTYKQRKTHKSKKAKALSASSQKEPQDT